MNQSIFIGEKGRNEILGFYDRMLGKWDDKVTVTEIDVETDAGITHILTAGKPENPPLILLHGSTSNAATWLPDFVTYEKEFHVFAPDMPGEPGKSTETRLSWKNDDYCIWLLQVMDRLGLKKANLVGLSLGGWVALKFAAAYPEKTGNVGLIAPGGIVSPNMKAILKLVKYQKEGAEGVNKTLRLLFPDDFNSPEVVEFFTLLGKHFKTRVEAVPKLDNEVLGAIRSNVFMLAGSKDVIFNFRKASKRLLKQVSESEVLLFDKGTHGLVSMADAVVPFLKR